MCEISRTFRVKVDINKLSFYTLMLNNKVYFLLRLHISILLQIFSQTSVDQQ